MDKTQVFGEILEKGQSTAQNAVSDVKKSVKGQVGIQNKSQTTQSNSDGFSDAIKNQMGIQPSQDTNTSLESGVLDIVKDQIGIANESGVQTNQKSQSASDLNSNQNSKGEANNTQETNELVKEFYEKSEDQTFQNNPTGEKEAAQKLEKAREELKNFTKQHREVYYDPLFAYENKKTQQEETTQERVEKQEMQDLEGKQKKQEKMAPISVLRAQTKTEAGPGVTG